jgi:tRNA A-37 threonylcarbamoyl transferase component Bud32
VSCDSETIRDRLLTRVHVYYPELVGIEPELLLEKQIKATYSTVYLFQVKSKNQGTFSRLGVAVKVFSPPPELPDLGIVQYSSLCSVWPLLKNCRAYALPRPLDYFRDLDALVSERAAGESLQSLFGTHRWTFGFSATFRHACVRSAQWLRRFHDVTRSESTIMDVQNKLMAARSNLSQLAQAGLRNDLSMAIGNAMRSAADKLENVRHETAMVHGDYTVDNVLFYEGRVTALDLSGRHHSAVYHDIGTFLNSLSLIGMTWPMPKSAQREQAEAFLSGYFPNRSYDQTALWFLRVAGLTATATEILNRNRNNFLANWWILNYVTRTFAELQRLAPFAA